MITAGIFLILLNKVGNINVRAREEDPRSLTTQTCYTKIIAKLAAKGSSLVPIFTQ
jgi:hypothetical protein